MYSLYDLLEKVYMYDTTSMLITQRNITGVTKFYEALRLINLKGDLRKTMPMIGQTMGSC
jgi:hypothetical protein